MRAIGQAEFALEMMCERALTRSAFGKKISELGANYDIIANSRIEIDHILVSILIISWWHY